MAGLAARLARPGIGIPQPPEIISDDNEPVLMATLRRARLQVLQEPQSAKAWGELGEVFYANDLESEALACFAQAERLDAADPRWPYFQAGPLLNRGQRAEALPYLRRVVERAQAKGESNNAPRLLLVETLLTQGELDEAENHLRYAVARAADDPRGRFAWGLLHAARQDWAAARDAMLGCVDSPYARQKAATQLAALGQRLNDPMNADKYRKQAALLPPDRAWVDVYIAEYLPWGVKKQSRFRLVEYLESTDRLGEAAKILLEMTEQYPNDCMAFLELGKVLGRQGQFAQAEALLRTARRLAPEKLQTHYFLGLVLFMQGEMLARGGQDSRAEEMYRQAAELIRQALAIKPDYGVALMVLGRSLQRLGRRDEALGALREAARCNPEHGEIPFRLAEVLAETGQHAEACHHLERALQIAGPDATWKTTAATLLDQLHKR
jgi:tetratricopeptide (TPR) repeat protein